MPPTSGLRLIIEGWRRDAAHVDILENAQSSLIFFQRRSFESDGVPQGLRVVLPLRARVFITLAGEASEFRNGVPVILLGGLQFFQQLTLEPAAAIGKVRFLRPHRGSLSGLEQS